MSRYSAIDRPAHGVAATLAVLFLVALAPLHAQTTYLIDSTGDGADADTGDGVCADAGGACTLRAAIDQANATAGLDDIHFNIAGDGPHTIALASTLPDVTDPVVIDGYTQAGSSPNTGSFHEGTNAVLTIVLEAPPGGDVLSIEAGGSTVRGLRIEGVTDLGIVAYPGGGNTIEGNVILAETSGYVVWIDGSDNTVGGTTSAARNVIGGGFAGVYITGGSGNVVQGNLIGTDAAGTGANGSDLAGVVVVSPGNTIGGDVPGAGNVISANGTGIRVSSRLEGETVIQGNLVGTDVTGTADLGNVEDGMYLEGTPMRIGGTAAAARNVVSGNGDDGIELADNASDFVIEGNYIGVDITGAAAIPNEDQGLVLTNGGHVVGGTAAGAGNVISGNERDGIFLNAQSSTIQGNRIGTDATGTEPIPNVLGILINNASSNVIGGAEDGAANVIAANRGWGVAIMGSSSDNVLRGNFIGTDESASVELGNGVPAEGGDASSGVYIGGDGGNRVEGNVVAFSGYYGVDISSGTGNAVSGNRIFSNAELGISLPPPGVTPNDAGDADTGPNGLQNFPVVTLAYLDGGTVVDGTLHSAASTEFTLEFFASEACDPSDHGEGAVFLGSGTVTTDGAGDASFSETLETAAEAGDVVAATATDPAGNTSEFSTCVRVGAEPTFVVTAADNEDDGVCSDGHCSLREAIAAANAREGADWIHFDVPGEGSHVIGFGDNLPVITAPVVIDGYTQPGASANTNGPDQGTNAVVMIELSTDGGHGLEIEATSTVRGLRIIGATSSGIALAPGSDGSTIEGNFIDPHPDAYGIEIQSPDNVIGGITPAARNVIGGGHMGIRIEAGGASTLVQGNLIGTNAAGTGANGNAVFGISALGHATVIGGTSPEAGNVVSANAVGIAIATADSVLVQGNRVGTDVTGTAALGNTAAGISATSGAHHRFDGNLVSGNDQKGISIATDSVLVTGNRVGVDVGGTAALPNGDGVRVETEGGAATIGGTSAEAANLIAFNTGNGVVVTGSGATILGNAIYSNGGLGIDLGDDGVTENDEGDTDTGPSGYQNFPILALALTGSAELEGTFEGAADATFTLEFFSNDECSATGHGEGQRFLGATTVDTDGSGVATFAASLDGPAAPGDAVTATATDPDGNTSEFSECVTGVGYDVAATATEGTVVRGQGAGYDVTVTAIAGTVDRDVTLSCDGLPDGASCAFSPATLQPGATSATSALVVSTSDPETPTGEADFTVVGTFGSIERTAAATVTVIDFTVAAAPEQVTVTGGNNAGFTVTVAPDGPGFDEPVSLACLDLPAGAACSFSPGEVTPGSDAATATLSVSTAPLTAGSPAAWVDWTPVGRPPGVPVALALLAAAVLLGSRRRLPRRLTPAVAVLALVALAGLACGDPTGPDPEPDPDPVTTTFTITGTSGELERSTTATVRVE